MKRILYSLFVILISFMLSSCKKKIEEKVCDCDVTHSPLSSETIITPTPESIVAENSPNTTFPSENLVYVESIKADKNDDFPGWNFPIRAKQMGYDTIQNPINSQYYIYTDEEMGSIRLDIKLTCDSKASWKPSKHVKQIKFNLDSDGPTKDFKIRDLNGHITSYSYDDKPFILDWVPDGDNYDTTTIWLINIWDKDDTSKQKIFWINDYLIQGHDKWQSTEW